jgi:16S rRNA (cytosine967-C5)-methyltransferase
MAVVYSFPQWLVQRWRKRFGHSKAELLFSHLNTPPEFALRVIEHNITKCEAITKLENLGLMVKPGKFLESALYVNRLAPLIQDELLRNKLISIQDETSQLAVHSLQLKPGSLVLDACSGLGTKASHILDLATGIRLIALDNSLSRLSFADRRSSLILGDANFAPFKDEVFDAIILDAPCSSLGIIRKHPEIKWRRRENDINHFSHKQYAMLKSVWDKLKVGGHLVYSVCSFEPEETIDVINKFKNIRKFALENPLPFLFNKEYFVSLPFETGMDGFFIARLKKL